MNDETRAGTCDLCGLPVGSHPFALDSAGRHLQFCCEGCRGIYQLLHNIEGEAPDTSPRNPQPGDQP